MGKTFEEITDHHRAWIARQSMFFVATAPLGADGHVNVSPKSPVGSLQVLGPQHVAYLDVGGSGAETIAHVRENGRIVIMFCAFSGPPRIIRLHGTGTPVWPQDPRFEALLEQGAFAGLTGVPEARRAIVSVEVERVGQSCGYGVPLMEPAGEREHFDLSKRKRLRTQGAQEMTVFQATRNAESLDGLPAVPSPAPANAERA